MRRRIISLKTRVRYEGRAQVFDRRATVGADLEKLPNPIWNVVSFALLSKFRKSASTTAKRKK
jgi:hypothetical protein